MNRLTASLSTPWRGFCCGLFRFNSSRTFRLRTLSLCSFIVHRCRFLIWITFRLLLHTRTTTLDFSIIICFFNRSCFLYTNASILCFYCVTLRSCLKVWGVNMVCVIMSMSSVTSSHRRATIIRSVVSDYPRMINSQSYSLPWAIPAWVISPAVWWSPSNIFWTLNMSYRSPSVHINNNTWIFFIGWLILLVIWILLDLPLGFGAGLYLQ